MSNFYVKDFDDYHQIEDTEKYHAIELGCFPPKDRQYYTYFGLFYKKAA